MFDRMPHRHRTGLCDYSHPQLRWSSHVSLLCVLACVRDVMRMAFQIGANCSDFTTPCTHCPRFAILLIDTTVIDHISSHVRLINMQMLRSVLLAHVLCCVAWASTDSAQRNAAKPPSAAFALRASRRYAGHHRCALWWCQSPWKQPGCRLEEGAFSSLQFLRSNPTTVRSQLNCSQKPRTQQILCRESHDQVGHNTRKGLNSSNKNTFTRTYERRRWNTRGVTPNRTLLGTQV